MDKRFAGIGSFVCRIGSSSLHNRKSVVTPYSAAIFSRLSIEGDFRPASHALNVGWETPRSFAASVTFNFLNCLAGLNCFGIFFTFGILYLSFTRCTTCHFIHAANAFSFFHGKNKNFMLDTTIKLLFINRFILFITVN